MILVTIIKHLLAITVTPQNYYLTHYYTSKNPACSGVLTKKIQTKLTIKVFTLFSCYFIVTII
jgi:hypothetical protein